MQAICSDVLVRYLLITCLHSWTFVSNRYQFYETNVINKSICSNNPLSLLLWHSMMILILQSSCLFLRLYIHIVIFYFLTSNYVVLNSIVFLCVVLTLLFTGFADFDDSFCIRERVPTCHVVFFKFKRKLSNSFWVIPNNTYLKSVFFSLRPNTIMKSEMQVNEILWKVLIPQFLDQIIIKYI